MNSNLSSKLQIWGIDQDTVVFADASLGGCFEAYMIDSEFWANEGINASAERFRTFLNSLPENTDVQFIKSIDYTSGLFELKDFENEELSASDHPSTLLENLNKSRQDFFRDLNKKGVMPSHRLYIVFRKPMKSSLIKKSSFFKTSDKIFQVSSENLKTEIDQFQKDLKTFEESLKTIGLTPKRLTETEVLTKIYKQWNPSRKVALGVYNSDDVKDSLLYTDAVIQPEGFRLGNVNHKVLSLKMLPEATHAGMTFILNELPFGSEAFVSIHVPVQSKELESLQSQRRLAFSLVNGRPGRVRDLDAEAKLSDLEGVIENLVQGGEKVFRFSLNIVLKNPDQDVLEASAAETLAKIRDLSGAEAMVETVAAFDIFSEVAFPNARSKERQKRLKTSNLADFLPLHGSWLGHSSKEAAHFRNRSGSLVSFDPFSSDLTNANQLISGASGSGKSYLTNNLLLKFLKDDPKIFIIDIGGSYKKLTESLDGQYIPLGVGSNISLNPFDLAEDEITPSHQKIKFLVGLIETMTKEDGQTNLPRLERAELEEAIMEVYRSKTIPKLTSLKEILLRHKNPKIQSLGKILFAWTGETSFGQFMDRSTNIELKKKIICFDLKGLETHPDLQAACLFVITDLVWRSVQADKSSKKYLIFDECWRILESSAGASLVGDVFRTFRKYFASAIAISQTVDDFSRSSVAHAIIPNSSIKWLLKQKGSDKENLRKTLTLNDHELSVIDSLEQDRGTYSEAFLMAGDNRSVVRIEATPLEYWISTTDPRDLSEIDRYTLEFKSFSLIEVLTQLARKYPKGISSARQEK